MFIKSQAGSLKDLVGGLLAAIFGFIDWTAVPSGTRAKAIGLYHGVGNLIIVVLFAVSWFLRRGSPDYVPSTAAFVLGLAGIALALVTGWLGGELVYRLRVGVDTGANLDAPNSLTDPPAGATGREARSRPGGDRVTD